MLQRPRLVAESAALMNSHLRVFTVLAPHRLMVAARKLSAWRRLIERAAVAGPLWLSVLQRRPGTVTASRAAMLLPQTPPDQQIAPARCSSARLLAQRSTILLSPIIG